MIFTVEGFRILDFVDEKTKQPVKGVVVYWTEKGDGVNTFGVIPQKRFLADRFTPILKENGVGDYEITIDLRGRITEIKAL